MANITKEDVLHTANLSKLKFEDSAVEGFRETFEKIVDMVESLNEVDTEGVEFTMNVADNESYMREDVPVEPWNREELLRSVPTAEEGYIQVPAIIDNGEGDA
ncbi:MAG: Asp-tRNA(Asn)/Glu-tRNA(Gln) amidotransferase subunit GatC [Streptococcaceae bacterium]|jgi:aspartyl-tRNA(Asn)/glutamyl-tRNA(Gln) amidotransferase subunit C|nr:Asp-tRNA(Asn)/Glu-tRNA(Gln) amidotransferase subunit GatC [Streptococcaceae bacterium]